MREIALFVEDYGHEQFIKALLQRIARSLRLSMTIRGYNIRGGRGRVKEELQEFIRDLKLGRIGMPDLLIVAVDANCQGWAKVKKGLIDLISGFSVPTIYAIPDPHIERWMLLDSAAFKKSLALVVPRRIINVRRPGIRIY